MIEGILKMHHFKIDGILGFLSSVEGVPRDTYFSLFLQTKELSYQSDSKLLLFPEAHWLLVE